MSRSRRNLLIKTIHGRQRTLEEFYEDCSSCGGTTLFRLVERRQWLCVAGLPVFPEPKEYRALCSRCGAGVSMDRTSFEMACLRARLWRAEGQDFSEAF